MEISRIKPKWCTGCDDTFHNKADISSIRANKLCNWCIKKKKLDKELDEQIKLNILKEKERIKKLEQIQDDNYKKQRKIIASLKD